MVTAVSWFVPSLKAFAVNKRADAFSHLGLTILEQEAAVAMEKRLRARLAWSAAEQKAI